MDKRIKLYAGHEANKRKNEKWIYRDASNIFTDMIVISNGITFYQADNLEFG